MKIVESSSQELFSKMFKMFPQKIKKINKKKISKGKIWIFKNILRVENEKIDELSSSQQKLLSKMFKRFKKEIEKKITERKKKKLNLYE